MIYLDNSATTKPYPEVIETAGTVAERYFANPSSAHQLGEEASALLKQARQQIAQILKVRADEVYFTASGTEANNWVLQGIVDALHSKNTDRKRVLLSAIEHPASLQQIELLQRKGYDVDLVPVDEWGRLDTDKLRDMLDEHVLLLSTMAVNNEVGTVQPLAAIAEIIADYPQLIWHVDGVQAVTTELELLRNKCIDLLTLSAHKFHGLRGVGVLVKKERVASFPLLYGGGQEAGQRSSTENLPAIVASAKALRLADDAQAEARRRLHDFRVQLVTALEEAGWQIFGGAYTSTHIVCAALPPIPGEVLLHAFERMGIFVSTTSACSSRSHNPHATLNAMRVSSNISNSAIRLSLSHTTTQADITAFIQALPKITQMKGKG